MIFTFIWHLVCNFRILKSCRRHFAKSSIIVFNGYQNKLHQDDCDYIDIKNHTLVYITKLKQTGFCIWRENEVNTKADVSCARGWSLYVSGEWVRRRKWRRENSASVSYTFLWINHRVYKIWLYVELVNRRIFGVWIIFSMCSVRTVSLKNRRFAAFQYQFRLSLFYCTGWRSCPVSAIQISRTTWAIWVTTKTFKGASSWPWTMLTWF